MGKAPAGKAGKSPPPKPPEEEPIDPALEFLEIKQEQEEAVSEAIEAVLSGVVEFIRGCLLKEIVHDNTAAVVTDDIAQIYATVDIRYDPGRDDDPFLSSTSRQPLQARESSMSVANGSLDAFTAQQQQEQQSSERAGTLVPSPEPQPAPIDRWARGWVVSRTSTACDWNQRRNRVVSDVCSEDGRSLRSVKSLGTASSSAHRHPGHGRRRSHHSNKEDQTGVPFAIAPEVREDQSFPPSVPVKGSKRRKGGGNSGRGARRGNRLAGDKGGGGGSNGSENGHRPEGDADSSLRDDDVNSRIEELGGREWTIDGSGDLLIVERPKGDTMPKTVVSALFNFRDIADEEAGAAREAQSVADGGGGGGGGGDGSGGTSRSKGSSSSLTSTALESKHSGPTTRRASRRRSSRRVAAGRRRGSGTFFELEPTLQPNLTNSVDRPGAGVSVSDGSSFKEGLSWPQDPNHMSRSEYRERQRKQDLSDANTLDLGEDASTLGFSLGTVQSAPALGGLGLGQGGGGGASGPGSRAGGGGGRRAVSGGGSRGTSMTAFEDVNPFAGGIRVATSAPQNVGGSTAAGGGDLSPLSTSVGGQSSGKFFSGAGPETSSVGEDDDPHLALVKDPDWGRNVGRPPKEAGYLPKVKQVSRERPLTHERPHTRNPRDPRNIPARKSPHVSPKGTNTRNNGDKPEWAESDDKSRTIAKSSSFASLPMSLNGWGVHRAGFAGPGGATRGMKGNGVINMTKPKEILVEGLLR